LQVFQLRVVAAGSREHGHEGPQHHRLRFPHGNPPRRKVLDEARGRGKQRSPVRSRVCYRDGMANVLITGCSSGIGLLTAQLFAQRGDGVLATLRDPAKAGELERTRAEGLALGILRLDVTDSTSVTAAVREVLASAGHIDVLVNNAGIELRSSIEDADDEDV